MPDRPYQQPAEKEHYVLHIAYIHVGFETYVLVGFNSVFVFKKCPGELSQFKMLPHAHVLRHILGLCWAVTSLVNIMCYHQNTERLFKHVTILIKLALV